MGDSGTNASTERAGERSREPAPKLPSGEPTTMMFVLTAHTDIERQKPLSKIENEISCRAMRVSRKSNFLIPVDSKNRWTSFSGAGHYHPRTTGPNYHSAKYTSHCSTVVSIGSQGTYFGL